MEILTIYEKAKEELEKASAASLQNGLNISSITLIFSDQEVCYTGVNWSRINNEFLIEQTCSEYEAMSRLLFDGNNNVQYIITLDATTKLPVNPCNECQKLMVCLNPANISSIVITGEDSSVVLSELNPELLELIPQPEPEPEQTEAIEETSENDQSSENQSSENTEEVSEETVQTASAEPVDIQQEGSAQSVKAFDTSELEMIFDDWESADESSDSNNTADNKPFNIDAVTAANESSVQEAIQQQEAAATASSMYQQQMNAMYQQQMNSMYQQQMNGMYQQQPMNGMYQQQPMNGMYQQQPMNGMYQQQPMNGMYQQQPMNGMYQQQPMNGMYQQQPMNNGSMYMQPNSNGGLNSMYLPPNQQQNAQPVSKTLGSPDVASASKTISSATSVYSTNTGSSGDNNNAIFKDRLNNLLNTHTPTASSGEVIDDVLQSAKEKKKAAKMDAKYLKKFKNDEFQ